MEKTPRMLTVVWSGDPPGKKTVQYVGCEFADRMTQYGHDRFAVIRYDQRVAKVSRPEHA